MAMNYKLITFLTVILLNTSWLGAQYTESMQTNRVYRVSKSTNLEIINKYGKIHLVNWSRDSVKIQIKVEIQTNNASKLKKLKNQIDFDFTHTDYYIMAETNFEHSYGGFFQELKNITESIMPSGDEVKIDFLVMLPSYLNVKINNRFGDVFLDNRDGKTEVVLSNGDLKANKLLGSSIIEIKMGDAVINEFKEGKIDLSYSDLRVKEAGDINLVARSSEANIERVKFLKIDSRRDKIYIDKIDHVFGNTYFTEMWVYNLEDKVNLNLKYGNLNLENIHSDFSLIDIYSEYTDLNLFFDEEASYQIDINHVSINLSYPETIAKLKKEVVNESEGAFINYGTIGKGEPKSKVELSAKKCSVLIMHK